MAHIERIWVHDPNDKEPKMAVYVKLKPSGTVTINVALPPKFLQAILDIAQTAADAHEAQMRAEILGDADRHDFESLKGASKTGEKRLDALKRAVYGDESPTPANSEEV